MIDAASLTQMAKDAWSVGVYPDPRFPPSVYYRFLRLLTERMKPRVSVELGVGGGGASLHMALGHPSGVVIGVDERNVYQEHIAHVQEVCPNFFFWEADSVAAAEFFHEKFSWFLPIDILFIDTIHTYEHTMAEFAGWKQHLALGAMVALDDLFREGMDEVWQELPGEKVRFDILHIGSAPDDGGFGVIFNIPH